MKKAIIPALVLVLLLPLAAFGCDYWIPQDDGEGDVTIELSCDDFTAQNHIVRSVTLDESGTLTVILCANPSTGFQWGDNATIATSGSGAVIRQTSHEYEAAEASSEEMIVGAPGRDVWIFDPQSQGQAVLSFIYGQPWENGEKEVWSLTVTVTVE